MLKHLFIKNFAIIDKLDLELQEGLSVVTGETGAGKSIMIDALEIAMGARFDTQLIRQDTERCEIIATFDTTQLPAAQHWLNQHELNEENECIVQRIISQDGRSRSLINGRPCPLSQVRELSALLVHIYGQHEHLALLRADKQRDMLDQFAKNQDLCHQLAQVHQHWRQTQNALEKLQNAGDQVAQTELLQFQLLELQQLNLMPGELNDLEHEHQQLANADQIVQRCAQTLALLTENEDSSISAQLHQAHQQLAHVETMDAKLTSSVELINNAMIQVSEAADEIRSYLNAFEANPERLQYIEQRLTTIYDLARKHKVRPNELFDLQMRLQTRLQELQSTDERKEELIKKLDFLEEEYLQLAKELRQKRQKAAVILQEQAQQLIMQLGMPHAQFAVALVPLSNEIISAHGTERIEFRITTNPGHPMQPLDKIASGGELSRIGLAIQVVTAQTSNKVSIIFDEVDVGISGGTAEVVGKLLRTLGQTTQVFCITHLAQVAAQGHSHYSVSKQHSENETHLAIRSLTKEEKIAEIARLIGGLTITDKTLAHAREMLGLEQAEAKR